MEGEISPSVSSQLEDKEPVYVEGFRRIGIYSDSGDETMTLTTYNDSHGTQRIMLNSIDISLVEFNNYLNCLTKTKDDRINDLFYVGINASFMTGLLVSMVAILLMFIKIDC
jgi:hypothetical protein